ncbi:hypothetical protein LSAT2_001241, partial [Lamellibrachia satsuma]
MGHKVSIAIGIVLPTFDWVVQGVIVLPTFDWVVQGVIVLPTFDWVVQGVIVLPTFDWVVQGVIVLPTFDWVVQGLEEANKKIRNTHILSPSGRFKTTKQEKLARQDSIPKKTPSPVPAEQGEDDDFPSPSLPKKSLSDVSVSIVDKAWNVDTNDVTKTCDRLSDRSSQLNCSGDNVDDTTMKTNAGSDTPEAGKSVSASSSAPELTVNPKGKTSRENVPDPPPPGHISECRSKTMPPNSSNTGQLQCKMANFNLDRMKNAKLLAEKAIK